ncbi:MAG: hypothetical protein U0031_16090 [Thermomicrobiales bacterium]
MTVSSTPSSQQSLPRPPRIVIVGPCASGKTSLVQALRARGYDAHATAQEHSVITSLWRNRDPDVVIALQADLAAVRQRRGYEWPAWLHDVQVVRLREAVAAADLVIDTSELDADAVMDRVLAFLAVGYADPGSVAGEPAAGMLDERTPQPGGRQ